MRFGILLLAAGLLVGCGQRSNVEEELFSESTECFLAMTSLSNGAFLQQDIAVDEAKAREKCAVVFADDESFQKIAEKHLISRFPDKSRIQLKDVSVGKYSKAAYQKELVGKVLYKNRYGDFAEQTYFNMHVDEASYRWVLNFEEIPN